MKKSSPTFLMGILSSEVIALKAQPIVAGGNALGRMDEIAIALSGQSKMESSFGMPFQGINDQYHNSEGVALGYDGSGRWPVDYIPFVYECEPD